MAALFAQGRMPFLQNLACKKFFYITVDFIRLIVHNNGKRIPLINTALPRANQYFTAWHEIYHLLFDEVSFDHLIEAETLMEERKAEYFAALMLLGKLMPYFEGLKEMDF